MMWILFVTIFIVLLTYWSFKKPKNYPPGPISLPIFGNLLSVWIALKTYKLHHVVWKKWSEKYGNIMGLKLGVLDVVVVTGKDLIIEVSNREEFDGRPDGLAFLMRSFEKKLGLVFSDGKIWNKSRKTVVKCLRNFGFGSRSMEYQIIEECNALVDYLVETAGQPIKANHMFNVPIINILWKLVAGKRYDIKDERLEQLCTLVYRSFKTNNMSGGPLSSLPFLRYVIPDTIGYTEAKMIHRELNAFFSEIIAEHKATVDPKNPRDVIDILLIDMMQNKEIFTMEELHVIMLDLLEAGVETVNNTTVFMLIHLLLNPDVQAKLQKEIDAEVGTRKPILDDRSRMVYTEAVILEALRISTVAAMGIPHKAMEDAKLGDYFIPKGTVILLSAYELHNGDHWKEPTVFRPERFITSDNKVRHEDGLLPFGLGKRRCMGEGLARSELFIFLTHVLQRFNIKVPDGDPLPSTEPVDGITLSAKDFNIVFEPRF
ncbi:farnesoate epoxidase-like [Aricia agestis]|uniref:farnesoate epoxidase-like n=1 Tax=Aricia agestis TaxID=91739 RepID=UPI001C2040F5|nr:farnesoate epoxidase-like [Aricia agestis]